MMLLARKVCEEFWGCPPLAYIILDTLLDAERFLLRVADRSGLNVHLFYSTVVIDFFSSLNFEAFLS